MSDQKDYVALPNEQWVVVVRVEKISNRPPPNKNEGFGSRFLRKMTGWSPFFSNFIILESYERTFGSYPLITLDNIRKALLGGEQK